MNEKKNEIYFEPEDYFPEDIRKEFKLGEYNDDVIHIEPYMGDDNECKLPAEKRG